MPQKKTKTLFIALLSLNIVFLGIFLFLFNSTKSKITESLNQESEIKTQLKMDDVRVVMKEDLLLGKQYQTKLADYILPSNSTVDFIKTIETLALNSGLKSDIKTVINEPYDKGASIGAEYLRVNIDVIGDWKSVQLFIKYLETYPLKIGIKKMSLNKFSDYILRGRTIPQWSGSFEFVVVKMKDKK